MASWSVLTALSGFSFDLPKAAADDWLVDLGDVVVHVMVPALRDFYKLEQLWSVGDLESTERTLDQR